MQAVVKAADAKLLSSLDFNLTPSASYVTRRGSETWFPSGGNSYGPSGVRVLRWTLNDPSGWLDPSTVRVGFNLINRAGSAHTMNTRPKSTAQLLFQRLRITAGGALCEDIQDVGRLSAMFHLMSSPDKAALDLAESYGKTAITGLTQNASRFVTFRPLSGLLMQHRFIPLAFAPLTIELELGGLGDALVWQDGATTPNYEIQDARLFGDLVHLDDSVMERYNAHLKNGGVLPLSYNSWAVQTQSLTHDASSYSINIGRSFDCLKTVFFAFTNVDGLKTVFTNPGDLVSVQLSVGALKWPSYPCKSTCESLVYLSRAVGIHASSGHSMDPGLAHNDTTRIFGFDVERATEAGFTGINTRGGSLININLTDSDVSVYSVLVACDFAALLNIKDAGVETLG